jgi:hypothetical protein
MARRLKSDITGKQLSINRKGDVSYTGITGRVYPGVFKTAFANRRPPEGRAWIKDYNGAEWEVDAAELGRESEGSEFD